MYFPFVTPNSNTKNKKKLYRRKGGGGKGRGGSSGDSGGGSSGGSTGGGGRTSPISTGGTSRTISSTSNGGGSPITIPAGQPFAGRQSGGATRNEIYGNQVYGSGYPGVVGRGVGNRGFPFVFWPLAWGGIAGAGGAAYLHSNEYGRPDNTTRPGGALFTAPFLSASNSSSNSTFRLLADNTTTTSLIASIQSNCSSFLSNPSSISASAYTDNSSVPKPEQAVQYYRASSVALTLDGYNNTGALSDDDNATNTPLPQNFDKALLDCLNSTIGTSVPLVESGAVSVSWGHGQGGGVGVLALIGVIWWLVFGA